MWDKLKQYWPQILIFVLVLVAGIAVGWYSKPDVVKIEEKIKVVEVEKQVVVEHETVRVEVVRVTDTQVVDRWHREKTETKTPDGTIVTKEVEDRNIDTIVNQKENNVEVKVVEVTKEVVVNRDVVVEKVVTPQLAQWHAGILVGVAPRFDAPNDTAIVGGFEVERRIVGPIFAGAWLMGGSPLSGFKVTNAVAGVKVAIEF
jgi:hypothetical protein